MKIRNVYLLYLAVLPIASVIDALAIWVYLKRKAATARQLRAA